jgi:hypothetical protein
MAARWEGGGAAGRPARGGAPPAAPGGGGGGAPPPHGDGEVRGGHAQAGRLLGDAGQGHLQVLVDVDGQGPERRNVDDPGSCSFRRRRSLVAGDLGPVGGIDGDQEAGEGLAGPGG